MEEVTNYTDSGYPADVIYLDFQRLFDKFPQRRLLMKLDVHGIVGNILMWTENWLSIESNELYSMHVFRMDRCNEWNTTRISFRSTLFVTFINDIYDCVAGKILKFADDTKTYHTVISVDVSALQSDLSNLVAWSKECQMLFNVEKCKVMHIGYNNVQAEYVMNDVKLEYVSEEKDFRVIISDDLKSRKQCSEAMKKANRILGMIKRNFADRSRETIISLYKTLVRLHLEYFSTIWSPHYDKNIKQIESVQRRATKLVIGMQGLQYNEKLKQLGLMQLERQRVRSDLIETFKTINGEYDLNRYLFFQLEEGGRKGHGQKLFTRRFRLDIRKCAFCNRVVDNWNSLSASCINCNTINTFKKHLLPELELGAVQFYS